MRQEVKQSLLFWPTIASMTIIGLMAAVKVSNEPSGATLADANAKPDRSGRIDQSYELVDRRMLTSDSPPVNVPRQKSIGEFSAARCTITFGPNCVTGESNIAQSTKAEAEEIVSTGSPKRTRPELGMAVPGVMLPRIVELEAPAPAPQPTIVDEPLMVDNGPELLPSAVEAQDAESDEINTRVIDEILADVTGDVTDSDAVSDVHEQEPSSVLSKSDEAAEASVVLDDIELTQPNGAIDASVERIADESAVSILSEAVDSDDRGDVKVNAAATGISEATETGLDVVADGSVSKQDTASAAQPALPPEAISVIPESVRQLADLPRTERSEDEPIVADEAESQGAKESIQAAPGQPASWPVVTALIEDLDALAEVAADSDDDTAWLVADWANNVKLGFNRLSALDRLGNPLTAEVLAELRTLATDGQWLAESCEDRAVQSSWLSVCYDIKRRLELWDTIHKITIPVIDPVVQSRVPANAEMVVQHAEDLRVFFSQRGNAQDWSEYLILDDLAETFRRSGQQERQSLALRFVSRIGSSQLTTEQAEWLGQKKIQDLVNVVKPWVDQAVDYVSLLELIEQHEAQSINFVGRKIVSAANAMRFSDQPGAQRAASVFQQHYRNANMRIAVSEGFLRRLIPPVEPHTMPVQTTLFGNRVRGVSHVRSNLTLQLVPSPDRIAVRMLTNGSVLTQSVGQSGDAKINTIGSSTFSAITPIELSAQGYNVGNSTLSVRGQTRLRGLRTKYDALPILGTFANNVARSRYSEVSGTTSRVANRRIKKKLSYEIDTRAKDRMSTRSQQYDQFILSPLHQLALAPSPMELRTTQQRVIARYRVASDWQMSANTARPRAPEDSLFSIQVHQSALNNLLQRLVPREDAKSLHSILREGFAIFGNENPRLPSDLPEDVSLKFVKENPITFEFEDGIAWLTLRVVRLNRGDHAKLSRFIVRAAYKPQIDGMQVHLVRDGHLRISGPGMSMRQRLPLRAIFNKVLAASHRLPLMPASVASHEKIRNLDISQLEIRNGWLALAVSDPAEPTVDLLAMRSGV